MVVNANPAKVLIINTSTNKILKEIIIPTSAINRHGQFRHVRLTPDRTILVGLMKEGKVNEYDLNGNLIGQLMPNLHGQPSSYLMVMY